MAFTLAQPAYGQAGSYTAQQDRFVLQATTVTPGVRRLGAPSGTVANAALNVMTGDLAVTSSGATDSKVNVGAGDAFIYGGSGLGVYHAYNDAAILSSAFASCPTNTRIDLVTIQVTDTGLAAPSVAVVIVTGTAAVTPTAPATPAKAIALAQVTIPNAFVSGTSQVLASSIRDVRPKAQLPDFSVPSLANNLNSGRVDTPYAPVSGNVIFDTSVGSLKSYSNQSLIGTSVTSTLIGTGSKVFATQAGLSITPGAVGTGQRVRLVSRAGVEANPITTSSSSIAIGTGAKVFTVGAGLTFVASRVRVQSLANPANFVEGTFTYVSPTLTVTVDTTGGSGTFTDWLVSNVQNWMEGTATAYSGTSLTVSVDATSGVGTFTDWMIYGFAWEQPVKALASGVHDGTYRFVPQIISPSTATPLLPVDGTQWFQPDTNRLFIYDGSAWVQMAATGGWTAWTPTWTGLTVGTGGTNVGAYNRIGKKVEFYLRVVLGTTPAYLATTTFPVPVGTPAMAPVVDIIGTRGAARWQWFPIVVSGSTTVQLGYPAAGWATAATGGQLTGTMNVAGYATATAGDVLDISGWYVTT
jgi:hypothetical protein